jgi:hypothetical protein
VQDNFPIDAEKIFGRQEAFQGTFPNTTAWRAYINGTNRNPMIVSFWLYFDK